jgi:hypothetical protein
VVICDIQGRIQDFKLGGAHLKKLHRAEGSVNNFGVFCVKNHDFMPKIHIFSNFRGRGGRASGAPPTGRWFSPGIPVSSTNKIERHNITEILLKVALNTINPNPIRDIENYL